MIEAHPITSRTQWLDLRQRDVTASVVGALLGVHDYATRYSLWAEKTGRLERRPENAAQRRGRLLEGVAVDILRDEHPDWIIERGSHYYRDPAARLGATPDVLVRAPRRTGGRRDRGIVQIKTVEASVWRTKWLDAEGAVNVPLWIALQAIVEAHLTGSARAFVAALVIGHGVDLHMEEVPLRDGVIERIKTEIADFWRMIEAGEEPAPDYERDADTLEDVFRLDDGTEVDLSGDERFRRLVEERHLLKQRISDAVSALTPIEAEIIHRIGDAERAHLPGWRITRPVVQRRDRLFGTVTQSRQLRIKPQEERL